MHSSPQTFVRHLLPTPGNAIFTLVVIALVL